jgi:hypothetical protein
MSGAEACEAVAIQALMVSMVSSREAAEPCETRDEPCRDSGGGALLSDAAPSGGTPAEAARTKWGGARGGRGVVGVVVGVGGEHDGE